MHDNAGTCGSAGSSGGSSSLPGSSGDSPLEPAGGAVAAASSEGLRVDFYVLEEPSASARLKLACRLAEKAYLAAQVALVWHTDAEELRTFDEMLWTFMEGSFVPHDVLTSGLSSGAAPAPIPAAAAGASNDTPVLLSAGIAPPANVDIIINLAPEIPACLARTRRVAEIIDGDDSRRRAGRARFKAYRDLGIQPASHNIRGDA